MKKIDFDIAMFNSGSKEFRTEQVSGYAYLLQNPDDRSEVIFLGLHRGTGSSWIATELRTGLKARTDSYSRKSLVQVLNEDFGFFYLVDAAVKRNTESTDKRDKPYQGNLNEDLVTDLQQEYFEEYHQL